MRAKRSNYKTFRLDEHVSIDCNYYETRYSWGHEAELSIDGHVIKYKKITYQNRTWEAYTYQTILRSVVDDCKQFDKNTREKYQKTIENQSFSQDKDMLKSVAMVAKLGELLTNNKKEANDWKARMLRAGLENKGLIMPDDWEALSEEDKTKRLDGVISLLSQ